MKNYLILLAVFLSLFMASPIYAVSISLEGGDWIVRNSSGDSVASLSSSLSRDQALRSAFFLLWPDTGTVQMKPMEIVVTEAQFEVWKDGQVIGFGSTKDEAMAVLKNNEGDSITHPPDEVGQKK